MLFARAIITEEWMANILLEHKVINMSPALALIPQRDRENYLFYLKIKK